MQAVGSNMASILKKNPIEIHGWHEFLCKSHFSFLRAPSSPHELLTEAQQHGYQSLALCDFDGAYGLARFYLAAQPAQLKQIYGAEIHLQDDHDQPLTQQDTIALFALTPLGYQQLCSLLTLAHLPKNLSCPTQISDAPFFQEGKQAPYLSLEQIAGQPTHDLIAIQPMRGIMRARGPDATIRILERLGLLREIFGQNLSLAVSRHLHKSEDLWIPRTLRFAKQFALPWICSQDVFFHQPDQKPMSDLLLTIQRNQTLAGNVSHMFPNRERHLHALSQLEQVYGVIPDFGASLQRARELRDRFDFCFSTLKYRYPQEMIPPGYTSQSFLSETTWRQAPLRFGGAIPPSVRETLERELHLIEHLSFADYFLTVWDIVTWARSQGILCQGRGSAANSAVCYVLGITSVNPARFDLLFERFISLERGDPPDIDVDFEHERREEVIQYIYQRYGRSRAAMVANVICFRRKGSLRAAGKALGIPNHWIDATAKKLHSKLYRGMSTPLALTQLKEELRQELGQELRQERPQDSSPQRETTSEESIPWDLWAECTDRLRGLPRHLGIHSGGFIISDQNLDYLVPTEPASMLGRSVVQWCKEDIEGLGLFKIDILALGMLTALRKGFLLVKEHYGQDLQLHQVPEEDVATYNMIQAADTVGTFQIESRAQMSMLPRLRPKTFYDLVIEVAIIRPGPIQGGMIQPYLRRRQGLDPIIYPDKRLRTILERTLGIPIFQEQVMRIAMAVGGFTGGEADQLRKHIGSWNIKFERHLHPLLDRLASGMKRNGIAQEFITGIIAQLQGFAHYGFPESHALSFAWLAYASSYLKCKYPAAFFTAVLNSQPMGFYAPHALLQAAKKQAVPLLPTCVQSSDWDHLLEATLASETNSKVVGIRLGMCLIKGLSEKGAKALIDGRREAGGSWQSLPHLLSRLKLTRDDVTALAAADALRSFGLSRREALWWAEKVPVSTLLEDEEAQTLWPEESPWVRARLDFAAYQSSLGEHPCRILQREHWYYEIAANTLIPAQNLTDIPDQSLVQVFGMVLSRQAPPTAKGVMFMTMEDATGMLNLVFMPDFYLRCHKSIDGQGFLCVKGILQRNGENHSILVRAVFPYDRKRFQVYKLEKDTRSRREKPAKTLSREAFAGHHPIAIREYR